MTTQPSRPRWALPALVVSLLFTVAAATVLLWPRSAPLETLFPMPAFELTNQAGQQVRSDTLKGKIAVVSLIYTNCPDICPATTMKMRQLQERLTKDGIPATDATLLSISVDPERDTPAVLADYAQKYGANTANWHFLTGPTDYVKDTVVKGFFLGYEKVQPAAHAGHTATYEVSHSDRVLLIDRAGQVRVVYSVSDLDINRIAEDAKSLR